MSTVGCKSDRIFNFVRKQRIDISILKCSFSFLNLKIFYFFFFYSNRNCILIKRNDFLFYFKFAQGAAIMLIYQVYFLKHIWKRASVTLVIIIFYIKPDH